MAQWGDNIQGKALMEIRKSIRVLKHHTQYVKPQLLIVIIAK